MDKGFVVEKKNKIVSACLIGMVFLVGCNRRIEPSLTLTVSLTKAALSRTPEPTNTLTPTASSPATSTPTLSLTPLPTLTAAMAQAKILDLLKNNAGCKLPCWWGITPGETSWDIAKNFLESFGTWRIYSEKYYIQGKELFSFEFLVPEYIHGDGVLDVSILISKGVVEDISINQDIVLHEFLSEHGSPPEIWIAVGTNAPIEPVYLIVLFYPTNGFWLSYFDGDDDYVTQDDELFMTICPSIVTDPRISMTESLYWDPDQEIEFLPAIAGHLIPENINRNTLTFLPIEDAINIDIETFVSIYLDPNAKDCFLSLYSLWRPEK